MKIVVIVGPSGSGKTSLVVRLIAALKSRGLKVAAVKHCSHGFQLDVEGKDSWQHRQAGADVVALVGPGERAIIEKTEGPEDFRDLVATHLGKTDIVLIEAGEGFPGFKKIKVERQGFPDREEIPPEELLAVVSDEPRSSGGPVFRGSQAGELADFLIANLDDEKKMRGDER
ncbi:MAG: molybdopterin-guanine dinucleotide biosynthesis protein B [Candidatus Aminicenantales bacterium]